MNKYKAITNNGQKINIVAEDRYEAIRTLREQGYVIVSLEEE